MEKQPAIFLDRDGMINVEKNYFHLAKDWGWIPGAIDKQGFKFSLSVNEKKVRTEFGSWRVFWVKLLRC